MGCAKISAFSLRTQLGMPPGPMDLLEFKVDKLLKTWNSVTWKFVVSSSTFRCGLFGGRGLKSFVGARNSSFIKLARVGVARRRISRSKFHIMQLGYNIFGGCELFHHSTKFLFSFHHFAGALRTLFQFFDFSFVIL